MPMGDEFPSNSHAARARKAPAQEDKVIEKVIDGDVVRRKKPLRKRFAETFVSGDARGVSGYVMFEVLLPAARDMFADALTQGVERMIFGDSSPRGRRGGGSYRSSGGGQNYTNYGRFSSGSGPVGRASGREERQQPNTPAFDEIILATRYEADEVLRRLEDVVGRYGAATVSDLYEMVGVTPNHVDNKWGWKDMRGSGIRRIHNGHLLDLPRPEPLD